MIWQSLQKLKDNNGSIEGISFVNEACRFKISDTTEAAVGPLPAPGPYNIISPSGSESIRMALFTPSTVAKGWDLGIKEGATQIFRERESLIFIRFLSEKAKSFISKPNLFAYSISLISIWLIPSVLIESLLILPPNAS